MTNFVKLTPTRKRNVGYNVSVSRKLIRFSTPIAEKYGKVEVFIEAKYDTENDRIYFTTVNEKSVNTFTASSPTDKTAYEFSSKSISDLVYSIVPETYVTTRFPAHFVEFETFYIDMKEAKNATRRKNKAADDND